MSRLSGQKAGFAKRLVVPAKSKSAVQIALRPITASAGSIFPNGRLNPGIRAGEILEFDLVAHDRTPGSRGLSAIYTALNFDATQLRVESVAHSSDFQLFAAAEITTGSIRRLGGATLEPDAGLSGWTQITRVRMQVLRDLTAAPKMTLQLLDDGIAGFGRGTVFKRSSADTNTAPLEYFKVVMTQ